MDETICRGLKRKKKKMYTCIYHTDDGMDEISPFEKTNVVELKKGNITQSSIDPKNLGLNSTNKENLKGKNAEYNSKKIIDIYKGR